MALHRLGGTEGRRGSRRHFLSAAGAAAFCAACSGTSQTGEAPARQIVRSQQRSQRQTVESPPRPVPQPTFDQVPGHAVLTLSTPPLRPGLAVPVIKVHYFLRLDPQRPTAATPALKAFGYHHALPAELERPSARPGAQVRLPQAGLVLGNLAAPAVVHPEHVEFVGLCAQHILKALREAGFNLPDPVQIVLLDLSDWNTRGQSHPLSETVQVHNGVVGQDAYATIAHEIFHLAQFHSNKNLQWATFPQSFDALQATAGQPPAEWRQVAERTQLGFSGQLLLYEGPARFVEVALLPGADRYLDNAEDWFRRPGTTLMDVYPRQVGIPDADLYRSALFWKYVAEQHGADPVGLDTQRILLSEVEKRANLPGNLPFPFSPDLLRAARKAMQGPGHFDLFLTDPARWALDDTRPNLVTPRLDASGKPLPLSLPDPSCDVSTEPPTCRWLAGAQLTGDATWPNFLAALALSPTATRDSRLRFRDAARWERRAPELRFEDDRVVSFQTLPLSMGNDDADGAGTFRPNTLQFSPNMMSRGGLRDWTAWAMDRRRLSNVAIEPYAMLAWKIEMPAENTADLLRVQLTATEGMTDGFAQVIWLGRAGEMLDIARFDIEPKPSLVPNKSGSVPPAPDRWFADRVFPTLGAATILVLVCSRTSAGDFVLELSRVVDRPLLYATNWNTPSGRYLTQDPAVQVWNWRSPDLFLDGLDSALTLRIGNRGNAEARELKVRLEFIEAEQLSVMVGPRTQAEVLSPPPWRLLWDSDWPLYDRQLSPLRLPRDHTVVIVSAAESGKPSQLVRSRREATIPTEAQCRDRAFFETLRRDGEIGTYTTNEPGTEPVLPPPAPPPRDVPTSATSAQGQNRGPPLIATQPGLRQQSSGGRRSTRFARFPGDCNAPPYDEEVSFVWDWELMVEQVPDISGSGQHSTRDRIRTLLAKGNLVLKATVTCKENAEAGGIAILSAPRRFAPPQALGNFSFTPRAPYRQDNPRRSPARTVAQRSPGRQG